MNIQEIIVFVLIFLSALYVIYSLIQVFTKKTKKSCGCNSCDMKPGRKDIKSLI